MFKKLLIASVVLATGSTFAENTYPPISKERMYDKDQAITCNTHEFVSAPYIGASVGARVNFAGGISNSSLLYGFGPTVYAGVEGTLSGGYALTFKQRWYLAVEIFGADSAKAGNLRRYATNVGVQSNWSYGIDAIPGVILTDGMLAYLRVGGLGTNFNNISANKGGWQLGAGGQVNLTRNWDLRAEYVYSQYSSVGPAIRNIYANQFNFGVIYKFA